MRILDAADPLDVLNSDADILILDILYILIKDLRYQLVMHIYFILLTKYEFSKCKDVWNDISGKKVL